MYARNFPRNFHPFIRISLTYAFCRCKTMLHRETTRSLTYNFLSSLFFLFFFTTTSLLVKGSDFSPRIFELFFLSLFFLLFCLFRTLSSKKLDLSRVSAIRTSGFVLEKLRLLDLCQPCNLTFVGNNALANLLTVLHTSVHSYKKVSRILFYTLNNFI